MANVLKLLGQGVSGASIMGTALLTPFLRRRRTTWGATANEIGGKMPGDDMIAKPKWQYTQAITVGAPPEKVWPWLVQIGQGRGGFYSYEILENIVGCRIHNADRVIPECQNLAPGDNILLHPKVPMPVAMVQTGKTIALHYDSRTGFAPTSPTQQTSYFQSTWVFHIEPKDNSASRLVARFRIGYGDGIRDKISYGYFVEPISTTMQKQMLKGIKKRVEATR